jgi:hypothetical protein
MNLKFDTISFPKKQLEQKNCTLHKIQISLKSVTFI